MCRCTLKTYVVDRYMEREYRRAGRVYAVVDPRPSFQPQHLTAADWLRGALDVVDVAVCTSTLR